MKILEIKNSLVKISYEAEDNLALAGFIVIEDSINAYVGQIMNIKADIMGNSAIVKLLFTFNEEGVLKNYNGTIPSLKANVSTLPAKELLDVINKDIPVFFGNLAQQDTALSIDKSILENNLLVCGNNFENLTFFVDNITEQLSEKSVVIDVDGYIETNNKAILSRDFKLPLNYKTINYIYENDLEDIDAISKAVIQDIFLEVQQYTKTLPEGFIPFSAFYNVVDAQYKETQIPQLVLLKNKLSKYKEAGIFAEEIKDILNLSIFIDKNPNTIIDISNVKESLQKELISYIHEVLNSINETIYCFVKVNNANSDKKLLKALIANTNVFTTIICQHEYKYLTELKEISQNMVLFAPLTLQHDFASYNTYLNKLNGDEFVIYGAHTQNIPFIVEFAENPKYIENEEIEDENQNSDAISETYSQDNQEEIENETLDQDIEDEQIYKIETSNETVNEDDITDYNEETDNNEIIEEEVIDEIVENDYENIETSNEYNDEPLEEENLYEENNAIEDYNEDNSYSFEALQAQNTYEPVQNLLDDSEEESESEDYSQVDYVEPLSENLEEDDDEILVEEVQPEYLNNDDIVEQVAKDVDKALYEKLPQEDDMILDELIGDNELTEDDLNLIDDIAAEDLDTSEEEYYEEEQPPIVPIYPAEDLDGGDTPIFETGDRVSVAKFGEGIVERMINYGNKTLCSIDFPNIGRRLLDPAVTEIIKLP